ncbi:Palmitoyl-monogalactosyldiacylglycerol delta-7 chloroplastic [Chlorella sorokiniana]|uniref:Palmitoyl-monogalactosyldiacylglycerol delta-7 chloroplastic n=1 Tax=Chlorella sorokiniana TaxID=3076 RepID=A0A2P6TJB4_CHLSO|nr:Palmitoyl-monogalactosyldiacylglycerol delta-7 chloroplastic [Chlorella sorokiniana]|eukprot:PRW39302.1 Palmitoyl-monogalactosyldiacylglycerol delta-7 chloroplastic [Chlorella sorokiniana]
MTGKEVSYSRQWDDLFDEAPLKAPLPRLDTKRCLPSPSMELQAREPGAKLVPFTQDIWVLPKLRNWLFREPWSFYDIVTTGSILGLHLVCLAAPWTFTWPALWWGAALFFACGGLGIDVSFHRQLTHRSFDSPKWLEYLLAFLGTCGLEMDPISWVRHHRFHHRNTDRALDPHSSYEGFFWSHCGWLMHSKVLDARAGDDWIVSDLKGQLFYRVLEYTYPLVAVAQYLALWYYGGWPGVVWAGAVRQVLIACHIWGSRPYNTGDLSSNVWWLALATFGEAWHNNHHAFPSSARHGLEWWEVDVCWWVIRALQAVGLVWDVRLPTVAQKQKLLKKKTNGSKPGSTPVPTNGGKAAPEPRPAVTVALLAACAAAQQAAADHAPAAASNGHGKGQSTEISSSIVLAVPTDYLLDGSGRSKCMDMVDRASEFNVKRLQFVPTLFWVDTGPEDPPPGFDRSCKSADFLSTYYCYNRFNATTVKHFCYDRDNCGGPPQQWEIDRFRDALQKCMQLATSKGHDLSVNLHIDDATQLGGWRNTLNFDPLELYSRVWVTMQGEMGATIFFNSQQWQQVASDLRARMGGNGNVQVGVGINNAKLCGCILVPIVDQREFLAQFPAAFEVVKGEFDLPAIQNFFRNAIDFVSLSAYVPQATIDFQPCDMEGLMSRLDEEFQYYGLTLKQLQADGIEIHWGEFGVGGGTSPTGDKKATTAEEAAYTPFFGMSGPYTREKDPFILYDLAQPSPTAHYLAQGGCQYHVSHVYVWNLESWDVQAIYPISTTSEGSYRDPAIVQIINDHNSGRA